MSRIVGAGFLFVFVWLVPTSGADAVADWLAVRAVVDGNDPHAPIPELGAHYGIASDQYVGPNPRTPAALLLKMPYALVPLDWVPTVGKIVASLPLLIAWWIVRPHWWALVLLIASVNGIAFGNSGAVVTLLVAVAVVRGSGVALGAATALRAWPWFIGLAFLVTGQWRAAVVSAATFFGLNAVGLLLPGVTLSGSVGALLAAHGEWTGFWVNLSPPLWVAVPVAVAGLWWVWKSGRLEWSVVPALMLSPVVWPHYVTVLGVLGNRRRTPAEAEGPVVPGLLRGSAPRSGGDGKPAHRRISQDWPRGT